MTRALVRAVALIVFAGTVGALLNAGGSDRTQALAAAAVGRQIPVPSPQGTPQWQQYPLLPQVVDDLGLRKTDKLSPVLDKLYRIDILARAANRPVTAATAGALPDDLRAMISAKLMRLDDSGRVLVFVATAGAPSSALPDLVSLGMQVQRTDDRQQLVQGMLPVQALEAASQLGSVASVRLPDFGVVSIGSVTTQGDAILGASSLRASLGVMGANVRVGVISDGLNGLAASQSTGDLPRSMNITTCNVVQAPVTSPPSPQPQPTDPGAGAEGTAMAEIVHDLAPSAELWFGYWGINLRTAGTSLDFNAAVNCLAQNVDVVVDDVGWFNAGPYDGSSAVSMNTTNALNNPGNRIRAYFTAVGNDAVSHYAGSFVNSGFYVGSLSGNFWTLQQFQASGTTTDAGRGLVCAPAVSCGDTVTLVPNGILIVLLEWNDTFSNSTNDYDLLVQDNFSPPAIYTELPVRQNGTGQNPTEVFAIQNTHGVTTDYNILIGNYKNTALPRTFNMFINCFGCTSAPYGGGYLIHNFNTISGSVPNQSDAGGGVLSVGAIGAYDTANGYTTIEPYSSRGPTADGRTKPDVTGIDCVSVTGDGGFPSNFCGTSAAAPHAAGIAALLLQCTPQLLAGTPGALSPSAARSTLASALENGAVHLGVVVPNNTFGWGRLSATGAAPLATCQDTDGDGWPDGMEIAIGKNPNVYCEIMRADMNLDGVVNGIDLAILAKWFTQNVPPAPSRYDLNKDGAIAGLDLAFLAKWFTQSVSSCP